MTPTVDSSPLATLLRLLVRARKVARRIKSDDAPNVNAAVDLALKVAAEARP